MVEVSNGALTPEEAKDAITSILEKTLLCGKLNLDRLPPNNLDYAIHLLRNYKALR